MASTESVLLQDPVGEGTGWGNILEPGWCIGCLAALFYPIFVFWYSSFIFPIL